MAIHTAYLRAIASIKEWSRKKSKEPEVTRQNLQKQNKILVTGKLSDTGTASLGSCIQTQQPEHTGRSLIHPSWATEKYAAKGVFLLYIRNSKLSVLLYTCTITSDLSLRYRDVPCARKIWQAVEISICDSSISCPGLEEDAAAPELCRWCQESRVVTCTNCKWSFSQVFQSWARNQSFCKACPRLVIMEENF